MTQTYSIELLMGVCPAGSEGAKQQRPLVADAEEKKSQISADSGLSVTSGSQVVVSVLHWYLPPPRKGVFLLFKVFILIFIWVFRKATRSR